MVSSPDRHTAGAMSLLSARAADASAGLSHHGRIELRIASVRVRTLVSSEWLAAAKRTGSAELIVSQSPLLPDVDPDYYLVRLWAAGAATLNTISLFSMPE